MASQTGKVFLITGGYGGQGHHLCSILYRAGGTVYLAGRSVEAGRAAVTKIQADTPKPDTAGAIHFLELDLTNAASIRTAVTTFKAQQPALDVLFHNAGIVMPPLSLKTAQGHDLSLATNVLGPFALTAALVPALLAAPAPRVVWTTSLVVDTSAPTGGLDPAVHLATPFPSPDAAYTLTKLANWCLAAELPRQPSCAKITSVAVNPGNCRSGAQRHSWVSGVLMRVLGYDARAGAYTQLWAGVAPEVTVEDSGRYGIPFGRWHPGPREDLVASMKREEEGGTGAARRVWEWCAKRTGLDVGV